MAPLPLRRSDHKTGPACAVATTLPTGIDVIGSKLGIEFTAHVEGGELVSLSPMRRRLEELFLEWSGATSAQDTPGNAGESA